MAYNSKPLRTVPFAISALVWFVGWLLMLIGLIILAAQHFAWGVGFEWFMVFFALVVVVGFILIQFTQRFYARFGDLCHTLLLFLTIIQLLLIDSFSSIDSLIHLQPMPPNIPPLPSIYSIVAVYISGIIIDTIVLFFWLILLNLEADLPLVRFFYGASLPIVSTNKRGITKNKDVSVVVDSPIPNGKKDVEMHVVPVNTGG
jgi:hypothetical protein